MESYRPSVSVLRPSAYCILSDLFALLRWQETEGKLKEKGKRSDCSMYKKPRSMHTMPGTHVMAGRLLQISLNWLCSSRQPKNEA